MAPATELLRWVLVAALCWLLVVSALLFRYRAVIHRLWREPVLSGPVLVLDSDDWGAGPMEQASALDDLARILCRFHDRSGRRPVLNLAIVLAVPDGAAMAADSTAYRRICIDQAPLSPVLEALRRGEVEGVFALQLHGLEHFLPETLLSSRDPEVRSWLRSEPLAATENLPPRLQCRWVDASQLPSRPLPEAEIQRAVAEEVSAFRRAFGRAPTIVVPPSFVWTPTVERAWASRGIEGVVTPGERYIQIAADGSIVDDGCRFANGDRAGALTYLVRSDYFEPARGRGADHALQALRRASKEGRPCVLENHRVNFCNDPKVRQRSLLELDKLLAGALAAWPDIRFLSSQDLLAVLQRREAPWIRAGPVERFLFFWERVRRTGRFWKLLTLTGIALPGTLAAAFCARTAQPSHG